MTMIPAGLSAFAALEPQLMPVVSGNNIYGDVTDLDDHIIRTIATLGMVIVVTFCHQSHKTPKNPIAGKPFVENLLLMMGFIEARPNSADLQRIKDV